MPSIEGNYASRNLISSCLNQGFRLDTVFCYFWNFNFKLNTKCPKLFQTFNTEIFLIELTVLYHNVTGLLWTGTDVHLRFLRFLDV